MPTEAERILKPWLYGRPGEDGEWRAFCPYCEDPNNSKTPSASILFTNGVWHCMGKCGAGGSIRTLIRIITTGKLPPKNGEERSNVVPIKKGADKTRPMPSDRQIKLWTKKLFGNERALRYMMETRGLSKDTIKKYRLGFDGQRFTIPILDRDGEVVNIRRYKPNARDHKDKMKSWGFGTGEGRLDGLDVLAESDWVVYCEGELDRRIAMQEGFPTITDTAGVNTFKVEWVQHFKGKRVFLAFDEDQAGAQGTQKARRMLEKVADEIWQVTLGTGVKGGDITDFFVKLSRGKAEFQAALDGAKLLYRKDGKHSVPVKGKKVSVEESQNPGHNYPIEMTVMVAGKEEPPYLAPKKIIGKCDMGAAAYKCAACFFAANDGERTVEFDPDNKELLNVVGAGEQRLQTLYAKLTEANCTNHVVFDVPEQYAVEELAITPSVEHRTEDVEVPIHRVVYNVGTYKTPVNQLARIVGKQEARPQGQRAIIHGWHIEPVESDLDTFAMTPELMEKLKRFQPERGQSPLDKCIELADDMAANVTHIYGRPLLHVGYDLTWHSIISFMFEGKPVTKGWLECLVIGDTRTGKSETAGALARHYGAGIVKPLEGASFAGLVGGNDKMQGDHFMVKWGLIPLNDRRLVVLDEMSGLFGRNRESRGIIEEMSSIRSEGKAQISKIASAETSARTRMIWISNPLNAMSLAESSGGSIPALQDLVRNPEDIARFDYVMAESGSDVPSATINRKRHRAVKHTAVQTYSHALVMWAWSRKAEHVQFSEGVEEYIYAAAEDLGSRYIPDPPLIQVANARIKVARLAVALAARTFSTDKTGQLVVVKKAHVQDAVRFLDEVYGKRAMGYKERSERIVRDRQRAAKSKKEARKYLRNTPGLAETLRSVGATDFRKRDFEEFGGVDREDVGVIIPRLLSWRLITRKSRGYLAMEPVMVELLRELEDEGG